MDDNSEIECVYRKDGTDFKLSWHPGDIHTLQTWQNGQWEDDHHWSLTVLLFQYSVRKCF